MLVAALSASMLWLSRPRTPRQFQAAADSTTAVRALGENQRPGVRSLDDEECEECKRQQAWTCTGGAHVSGGHRSAQCRWDKPLRFPVRTKHWLTGELTFILHQVLCSTQPPPLPCMRTPAASPSQAPVGRLGGEDGKGREHDIPRGRPAGGGIGVKRAALLRERAHELRGPRQFLVAHALGRGGERALEHQLRDLARELKVPVMVQKHLPRLHHLQQALQRINGAR